MNRADLRTQDPDSYQTLLDLSKTATTGATAAELDPLLVNLVNLRTSQINGCAFCLRKHTQEALEQGDTADRLAVVSAWRETGYFTAAERAALELAEGVTRIGTAPVGEDAYARIAAVLTERQIAAVTWLAVAMNALNRMAIAAHTPVRP